MSLPYNPKDKKSVLEFAKLLKGKSLREICGGEILKHNYKGKGNFGQLLEKFYFGYEPNSKSEADFPEIGIELKSSPLKRFKNREIRSKERLVLNIINYLEVINQHFEGSDFWKKNSNILFIFYLYESGYDVLDFIIKLVDEWYFPDTDLEIIKKDWEFIKQKIKDGKAHELSEGDTFYLGACTKGANSNSKRKQPFSEIPAKQRAYSLKQGYVNHIIASIANEPEEIYGRLISSVSEVKDKSLEEIIIEKFQIYYGKSINEISTLTGIKLNLNAKNFYSILTHAIFNIELNKEIEEFEKANIIVKTIRVNEKGKIEQSVSFPAFEFNTLYNEHWITSELNDLIVSKFLFIFFKEVDSKYILDKVKFWNMSINDQREVRRVWLNTKRIIQDGNIFKEYQRDKNGNIKLSKKGNQIKFNNFPKITESEICHVRPHGQDSNHTYDLPVEDKILKVKKYTKQCFWFNSDYVRDEIYLK